jgi:hypothetical protein
VRRLDKAWGTRLILQHPAQLPNGHGHDRLADHHLRPDRGQQGVFGHQLAGLCHQTGEHRKGFGVQMDDLLVAPQPFVVQIQSK